MTTNELLSILSKRYPTGNGEYAFLTQVRSATGYGNVRTADALSLGLWPSRGQNLNGFELKVSRGDFLTEIKNPAKADEIAKYCDYWWIVVPDLTVATPADLPENWGLMAVSKGKIYVVKEAVKLEAEPISKKFLAGILRNVTNGLVPRESVKPSIDSAFQSGKEAGERNYKRTLDEFVRFRDKVSEFEKASGVSIVYSWKVGDIGEAVKAVLEGKDKEAKRQLERIKIEAEQLLDFTNKSLERLND